MGADARARPPLRLAHNLSGRGWGGPESDGGPVVGPSRDRPGAGVAAALLPYLVDKFDLTYTLAAALVLAATISSSLIQPAFGLWSDARGALWLLPAGVALAGVGMAATSVAPAYWVALVCVLLAGIGVAAYHPEGSKFASYVSGSKRASGMSFFSVGGNVGFALGPLLAAAFISIFGLHGAVLLAVPGLLVAAALIAVRDYLAAFAPSRAEQASSGAIQAAERRGLTLLLVVVGLRSVAHMGLFTFIPLWEESLGHSADLRDGRPRRVPHRRRRRNPVRRTSRRPLRPSPGAPLELRRGDAADPRLCPGRRPDRNRGQ